MARRPKWRGSRVQSSSSLALSMAYKEVNMTELESGVAFLALLALILWAKVVLGFLDQINRR